jgi:hypothetical protein
VLGVLLGAGVAGNSGIEYQLGDAVAVTQIDEDEAAVIAPLGYPAGEHHFLAFEIAIEITAGMSTDPGGFDAVFYGLHNSFILLTKVSTG